VFEKSKNHLRKLNRHSKVIKKKKPESNLADENDYETGSIVHHGEGKQIS
jgi:hypothetical protein